MTIENRVAPVFLFIHLVENFVKNIIQHNKMQIISLLQVKKWNI